MKRINSIVGKAAAAATLAFAMAATSIAPAAAAPQFAPRISADNGVINVQQNRAVQEFGQENRRYRRHDGPRRGEFHRRGDNYYYNGHRGHRHKRPGYRYHNGWWFPAGAFVAGAIIGNAINNSQPAYREPSRMSRAHVNWCYNRYRSYREYDNTFQPYNGPRQQCWSPYS